MSRRNSPQPIRRATVAASPSRSAGRAPTPPAAAGGGGFLRQAGGFVRGFTGAVVDTGKAIGTLLTDRQVQQAVWNNTKRMVNSAIADPKQAARDVRNAVSRGYSNIQRDWRTAQAQGKQGEFAGRLGANLLMTFVPGGALVRGATTASKLGRIGAAMGRLTPAGKAARAAGTTKTVTGMVRCPKTGKMVPAKHPSSIDPRVRSNLSSQHFDPSTGQLNWPKNNGFAGPTRNQTMQKGQIFERWGGERGNFVTPPGTDFRKLGLPYDQSKMPLTRYEVLKPFPVQTGKAAPAFGSPGGGTQMMTEKSLEWLRNNGYIRRTFQ